MIGKLLAVAAAAVACGAAQAQERVKPDLGWPQWLKEKSGFCDLAGNLDAYSYVQHLEQGFTQAETDAEFEKRVAKAIEEQTRCLAGTLDWGQPYQGEKKADLDKAIATTPGQIRGLYQKGRAEFLANPSKYTILGNLPADHGGSIEGMERGLRTARSYPVSKATCGSLNLPGGMDKEARRRFIKPFSDCIRKWVEGYPSGLLFSFESSAKAVPVLMPFACSVRPGTGCFRDEVLARYRALLTPENLAFVRERDKWYSVQRNAISDAEQHIRAWITYD